MGLGPWVLAWPWQRRALRALGLPGLRNKGSRNRAKREVNRAHAWPRDPRPLGMDRARNGAAGPQVHRGIGHCCQGVAGLPEPTPLRCPRHPLLAGPVALPRQWVRLQAPPRNLQAGLARCRAQRPRGALGYDTSEASWIAPTPARPPVVHLDSRGKRRTAWTAQQQQERAVNRLE